MVEEAPNPPTGRVDFFVSYAREDHTWAAWIEWQLRKFGYSTIWDAHFRHGDSFPTQIEEALSRARATIALISPSYLESRWAMRERDAALALATDGDRRLVVIRLRDAAMPPLMLTPTYIDLSWADSAAARQLLIDMAESFLPSAALPPPGDPEPPFPLASAQELVQAGSARHRKLFLAASEVEHDRRLDLRGDRIVFRPVDNTGSEFKDRLSYREQIGKLIAAPRTRIVEIVGPPGIGKTALAGHILTELTHDRWPQGSGPKLDGVVNLSTKTGTGISLRRIFAGSAQLVGGENEQQIIRLWSNGQITVKEKVDQLLQVLQDTACVILLDNLEDLLDPLSGELTDGEVREFVEQHLRGASSLRVLTTSRLSLTVSGQDALAFRTVSLADGLETADAVQLLRSLDDELVSAPDVEVAALADRVFGVPRALELFVALRSAPDGPSPRRLSETFFTRKDVVAELFQSTFTSLTADQQATIRALALYSRPVPVAAVARLMLEIAPGLDIEMMAEQLLQRRVLRADPDTGMVSLHPLDQEFLLQQPTGESFRRERLEALAGDYWAEVRIPYSKWRAGSDLEPHLQEYGHRQRAGDWNGAARVLSELDRHYRIVTWDAVHFLERRLVLGDRIDDEEQLMWHEFGLGIIYTVLGPAAEAALHFERALVRAGQLGNETVTRESLGWLGVGLRALGRLDDARKQVMVAREQCAVAGERWAEAWWSGELSLIECYRRSLDAAEEAGRHVQRTAVECRDDELGGRADDVLALTSFASGDYAAAADHAKRALEAYRVVNVPDGQAFIRNLQGMIALSLGQLPEADSAFLDTRDWGRQLGIPRLVGIGELHIALVRYRQGDFSGALQHAREAEETLTGVLHPAAAAAIGIRTAALGLSQGDAVTGARGLLDYSRAAQADADLHPPASWITEARRLASDSGEPELTVACERLSLAANVPTQNA